MSQQLTQFQDGPSALRVETWPSGLYVAVSSLAFSGSQFIKPNHNSAGQNAWLVGGRNVCSWHFKLEPDGHRGVSFFIHAFPIAEGNPATSTEVWRVYALHAGDTGGIPPNSMQGLVLPSMYCYFEMVTAENNVTVNGYIKIETKA